MATVPTGTVFSLASAFAAAKVTTIVSNAAEAVVTANAHGMAINDIVELNSGWGRLHLRAFRVKAADANTITLEGCDTLNLNYFPAGGGIGSVRKVQTWAPLAGVMNPQASGGEPKNTTYKFTESDTENSINDGFTATSYTLDMDADQLGTVGYNAAKALTDAQTNTILRMVPRNNSVLLVPGTVALNEAVKLQDGQINKVTMAFNGSNRAVRYGPAA
jgi:hypothetical protein